MPRILFFLLLGWAACLPAMSPAQGTCGPSSLGAPCPRGGIATAAAAEPALNLGAGNPIHLATGNKYQLETDLPPNPQAPGIELLRHYNAQDLRQSALGGGWAFSYDTRLFHVGGRWQLVQADGSRVVFAGAAGKPLPGPRGSLSREGAYWLWAWPDGRRLWFDARGDLVRIHGPDGGRVDIQRHPPGGPLARAIAHVRNHAGAQLSFSYRLEDGRPYVSHVDTPQGRFHYGYVNRPGHPSAGPLLADVRRPDGMQRRYLYEAERQSGNPQSLTGIEVAAADGRAIRLNTWAYDAQNRAVLSIAGGPDSADGKISLDYARPPGPQQSGLTIARDASGRKTYFETMIRGGRHLLLAVSGAGCAGCPPPGTRARYDAQGRLLDINGTVLVRDAAGAIRQVRPHASGWPALSLNYHAQGLRQGWSSTLTGMEAIRYNARGLPEQRLFANGDVIHYDYDAAGRPVRMAESNARHAQLTTLGWRGGLLEHIHHPEETEWRQYDADRRLRQRTVRRGLRQHRESFAYDERNRLSRHHLPEGGMLAYRWNRQGRLAAIHWHDAQGRIHTVIDSLAAQPGYLYGNGLRLQVAQNRNGQARSLALALGDKVLWTQHNHYDTLGRLQAERHTVPAADYAEHWRYAYSRRSQLIGAEGGRGKAADDAGTNAATRLSMWLAWNQDGSLAAQRRGGASVKPQVERDASGLPTAADGHDLVYGPGRRLESVQRGGEPIATYRHNAFGHRISRRAGGATTDYFYLDNRLVAEGRHRASTPPETIAADMDAGPVGASAAGLAAAAGHTPHRTAGLAAAPDQALSITRRYIYAQQVLVGVIDYQQAGAPQGRLFWAHADLVGAPRLLTDAAGQVRWLASYDPLGAAQRVAGDLTLDIRLPGQVHDPATGWHDNLLRTYMPAWGHYLEPDPLGPVPRNQALGYARQQPRRHADPLGLLLFAFDGTRHSPDTQSNVWKMSLAYRDGPVFYHSGPGNSLYLDMDAALAFSADRILDTQWLSLLNALEAAGNTLEYIPIDIIGFSRGAALARHFGNLIQQHMQGSLFRYTDAARGPVTACLDLRFMGLFDTVAQFGPAGRRNANYDLTISPAWEWVAHAVALHERRWLFPLAGIADTQGDNIVEAPFVGAHADIGGGSLRDASGQPANRGDLADVALNWMLWQARAAAAHFDPANADDREVSLPILHDERPALLRSVQDGDRRVDTAGGAVLHAYQDDHPDLGRKQRAATEAFIARPENWRSDAGSEAGTVDMSGYAKWLRDELGWRDAPA